MGSERRQSARFPFFACRSPKLRKALIPVRVTVTMLQATPHAIHFNRVLNLDEEQAGGRPLCY